MSAKKEQGKSKLIGWLCWAIAGPLGAHRFWAGRWKSGLAQLGLLAAGLTLLWFSGIWDLAMSVGGMGAESLDPGVVGQAAAGLEKEMAAVDMRMAGLGWMIVIGQTLWVLLDGARIGSWAKSQDPLKKASEER